MTILPSVEEVAKPVWAVFVGGGCLVTETAPRFEGGWTHVLDGHWVAGGESHEALANSFTGQPIGITLLDGDLDEVVNYFKQCPGGWAPDVWARLWFKHTGS